MWDGVDSDGANRRHKAGLPTSSCSNQEKLPELGQLRRAISQSKERLREGFSGREVRRKNGIAGAYLYGQGRSVQVDQGAQRGH